MTNNELVIFFWSTLKDSHFLYFALNIIAIILVAIFFAHKYSSIDKQIDGKLELQEIKIINKTIKMFKEAFKIIKKSGMML